jgi:predicted enzyme related to lactoylglutathione lyase
VDVEGPGSRPGPAGRPPPWAALPRYGASAWDDGLVDVIGVTTDVPVADLSRALPFYQTVLGRGPDLRPDDRTLEWILHRAPEIAVRLTTRPDGHAGHTAVRLGLGVADLDAEYERLRGGMADVPPTRRKPGVIALLELRDPDGNLVVLWQDLLTTSSAPPPSTSR